MKNLIAILTVLVVIGFVQPAHGRVQVFVNDFGGWLIANPGKTRLIDFETLPDASPSSAGVPIIGMGGIRTWQDAVEFLLAGATAVAVGTALFIDPTTPVQIIDGLAAYLADRNLAGPAELTGRLRVGAT